jgi:hypothetical protein
MEKVAICHTCCGPTYRETAKEKLNNFYKDDEDIFYFVITDDVKFFEGVKRKNLVVKNIKEFYKEYPHIQKYEYFLESNSKEEYGEKFLKENYKFPFSTNRLNFLIAKEYGIKNVALLGTDTCFYVETYRLLTEKSNKLYNCVSRWDQKITENNMEFIVNLLKSRYNLNVDETVRIYDAAGKLFCFESVEFMLEFFNIWDNVMKEIYETNNVNLFWGSYAINNEYILAPIYNALGIKGPVKDTYGLFSAEHKPEVERFWMYK